MKPSKQRRRRRGGHRPDRLQSQEPASNENLGEAILNGDSTVPVSSLSNGETIGGSMNEPVSEPMNEPVHEAMSETGEALTSVASATPASAPAPTGPLTLEDRCVRQFPRIALGRGRAYFNAGRVADPEWNGKECTIKITGTGGEYKLNFDFSQVADARRLPAH